MILWPKKKKISTHQKQDDNSHQNDNCSKWSSYLPLGISIEGVTSANMSMFKNHTTHTQSWQFHRNIQALLNIPYSRLKKYVSGCNNSTDIPANIKIKDETKSHTQVSGLASGRVLALDQSQKRSKDSIKTSM